MTPATVAARMLHEALMKGDIAERNVLDLGCGTGMLACGAKLLDAAYVLGIDTDAGALTVAEKNAEKLGLEIEFRRGDIGADDACGAGGLFETETVPFDTVVMNPPFGAQNGSEHADRPFIDAALKAAPVVYAVLNRGSVAFATAYTDGRAVITDKFRCEFPMKKTFAHHTKECMNITVEIVRMERV